jgi:hypothetical protein
MVNISKQLAKTRSNIDSFQATVADKHEDYQKALLSGEGSMNELRDHLSRYYASLANQRINERDWVNEQLESLKLRKDLLGLSQIGTA